MEYRVIMNEDKKRHLNVWVDNISHTAVYCDCMELQLLFYKALEATGHTCTQDHLNDFVNTYKRLRDFCFRFTDEGIVYYDLGGNAKNMAIYKGE